MHLFSSDRERRLWFWTLAVMVAILSTLGVARMLADALRERNLLEISFGLLLLLIVIALVVSWRRKRPGLRDIGVLLGVAFAYWMVWVRMESWEERTHLIEYGIVAALIHEALQERVRQGRQIRTPALLAILITALLGTFDEIVQAMLPNRVFDVRDIGFNALAGFMVIAARLALSPQKGPGWRIWLLWLLACAVGWGEGVYWGWFDNSEPKTLASIPRVILSGYLGLVVGATLMGVLQWLILRKHLARSGYWLLASLGAVALSGILIFGLGEIKQDLGWLVGISIFGTTAGIFQWLVLRGQVNRAGWWVLASTLGWVLGMPMGDINGPPGLGAIYGIVTATAIVLLLRQKTN